MIGSHTTPPGSRVISTAGSPAAAPSRSTATRRGVGTGHPAITSSAVASRRATSGSSASQSLRTKRRSTSSWTPPSALDTLNACTADDVPPASGRDPITRAPSPTARAAHASARSGTGPRSSRSSSGLRTNPCGA